jgi:flagellin-like protein
MQKRGKKSQASIITTVLIVLVALVAVGLLGTFIMRNIKQNVSGAEALSKVSDLKINKVELMPDGKTLRVLVKKEGSDSLNESYNVKMVITGADGKTQTLELDASLKPLESKYYFPEVQNGLKKIEIFPIVSTTSGQKVGRATDVYTPSAASSGSSGGLASLPKNPNCVKDPNILRGECKNYPCDMWDWDEGTCWNSGCNYEYYDCWNYNWDVSACQNAFGGQVCYDYGVDQWCEFYDPNYGYWTGWDRCWDYDSCNREWGCSSTWYDEEEFCEDSNCRDKDSCEGEFGCNYGGNNAYWNSYVYCYNTGVMGRCSGDNTYSCSDYSNQVSCENEGPCYWEGWEEVVTTWTCTN